jgi:hypothetical protein
MLAWYKTDGVLVDYTPIENRTLAREQPGKKNKKQRHRHAAAELQVQLRQPGPSDRGGLVFGILPGGVSLWRHVREKIFLK